MRIHPVRLALIGTGALALTLSTALPAWSHGYTQKPPSRSYLCAQGTVKNCGPIQYEPQSVEGPKGFPNSGPPDGHICSAGDSRWYPLDNQRSGTGWPTTAVTAGQGYDFTWTFTAIHSTKSFRYFITKNGWNPAQPLTRAALDPTPFLQVNLGGGHPSNPAVHHGTIPAGKTGRHMILAVWDIADTGNAFYACSDVAVS